MHRPKRSSEDRERDKSSRSDKPFKSRERFSREDGRGGRSDKPGAKSFKSDKPFSGKKNSDKEAKPRDFRKK